MQGKSTRSVQGERVVPLSLPSGPVVGDHNVDTHSSSHAAASKKRISPVSRASLTSPDPINTAGNKTLSRGSSPEGKTPTSAEKRKSPINDRRSPSGERERKSPANLRTSPVFAGNSKSGSPWKASTTKSVAVSAVARQRPVATVTGSQKVPGAPAGIKPIERHTGSSSASSSRPHSHGDDYQIPFVFEEVFHTTSPHYDSRHVHHSCSCPGMAHLVHHTHAAGSSCSCCCPDGGCDGSHSHRVLCSAVDEVSQTVSMNEIATQTGTPPGASGDSPVEEQFLSFATEFAEAERQLRSQQEAERQELRQQWIHKMKEVLPTGASAINKLCSRIQSAFTEVQPSPDGSEIARQVVESIDIPVPNRKGGDHHHLHHHKKDFAETHPVRDSFEYHESPDFDALIADEHDMGTPVWDSELVALMASRLGNVNITGGEQLRLSNDEIEEEVMRIIADVNDREIKKARRGGSRNDKDNGGRRSGERRPPAPDPEQMRVTDDSPSPEAAVGLNKRGSLYSDFVIGSPNKNCTFNWTTKPPGTATTTSAQAVVPRLDIAAVRAAMGDHEGPKNTRAPTFTKNVPDLTKHCHTLSSPRSAFSAPEKSTASSASNDDGTSKPSPFPSPRVVMTAAALRALAAQGDQAGKTGSSFQKVVPGSGNSSVGGHSSAGPVTAWK